MWRHGKRSLTSDGSRDILNGKLDWLYQEEIYGRGRFRGCWWSPDSASLAFLQLDERPVPEYTVVDDFSYRPTVEVTDYPKAGDRIRSSSSGCTRDWRKRPVVQLDAYAGGEFLIVDVDWVPDSRSVAFQVGDREQTWLDLNLADAASARTSRVLRETTPAWVNVNGSATWLKDGSFVWLSERSGFKHLCRYRRDGSLVGRVTDGRWEMRTFYGVDEERGVAYLRRGGAPSYRQRHLPHRPRRAGPPRLSRTDGTHRAIFNPSFTRYVGVWSDAACTGAAP